MKKIVCAVLAVFMLVFIFGVTPILAVNTSAHSTQTVLPNYIGINILSISLDINSAGLTTSTGIVYPSSNSYTAKLTVSLQKYTSSGWTTLNSWSGSGTGLSGASVNGSYYVARGTYRSRITARIYNSSGTLIETETAYSAKKTY